MRAQLFVTCMVDLFRPRAGVAAVELLERRGVEVEFPLGQTCCGQFAYNAGHHGRAAAMARQLVRAFEADTGSSGAAPAVIALSGSCASMIKHEVPELLERDSLRRKRTPATAASWRRRAEVLADRVVELTEWLERLDGPDAEVSASPAEATEQRAEATEQLTEATGTRRHDQPVVKIAVHTNCHMRRLLCVTQAPLRALRHAGVEPVELIDADHCCGFGGSFAMLEADISAALGDAKLDKLSTARSEGASCLVSPDLGCLMHLGGRLSRRGGEFPMLHIAEVVDLADRGRLTLTEIEHAAASGEVEPDAG